ncbi:MAG TPA: XVIPCD domain-containing protein [Luteibacter sp.]|jgi:putative chitinase|uniref:XVIPCD domain-containing protein n=1 Tax=Luteibacter sp. TaxID=1886636 RepID=UPI002F3EDDC8
MSYQEVMNTMLPAQQRTAAHITGHYGEVRAKGPHGGSDFNYAGGQSGVNLEHPGIHSPISGEVTFVGGQYGTIKIRDADGNSHEILHTQSQSVKVGQHIEVGDEIGQMGGRGPKGSQQYAQHVHYQMKDANGHAVNPEEFWRNRSPGQPGHAQAAHPAVHAPASHSALRQGDKGDDVKGIQEQLNQLGYRDERGRSLTADGDFGAHTKAAVEKFQRAHGLDVDGVVGKKTLDAIHAQQKLGPHLDSEAHPDHALYRQTQSAVHKLDAEQGRTPDHLSDRLAAAGTVAARKEGMTSVDSAVLNQDGSKVYVVQGELHSPFKQAAEVNTQQAINTTIEQSSVQWKQIADQQAATQAQQPQHQQTPTQQAAQPAPGH